MDKKKKQSPILAYYEYIKKSQEKKQSKKKYKLIHHKNKTLLVNHDTNNTISSFQSILQSKLLNSFLIVAKKPLESDLDNIVVKNRKINHFSLF